MTFILDETSIATLWNRHKVGVRWDFDMISDEDDNPIKNEDWDFTGELECWRGTATVYAQGPTFNDWSPIGSVLHAQLEGATTLAELDVTMEKLVRDELVRLGITAGATMSEPHEWDEDRAVITVPVTMTAA